jgi:hypothetical protein
MKNNSSSKVVANALRPKRISHRLQSQHASRGVGTRQTLVSALLRLMVTSFDKECGNYFLRREPHGFLLVSQLPFA